MNKNLFITIFLLTFSSLSFAQVVVIPTGDDAWKSVKLETELLDSITLPDQKFKNNKWACSTSASIKIDGDGYTRYLRFNENFDRFWDRILPARHSGKYFIDLYINNQTILYLANTISAGTENSIKVNFRRIDVHDMVVTREDGSKYTQEGKAYLSYKKANSPYWINLCSFNTQHGVSVPEGFQYKIKVKADTEDGKDYYEQKIDFRNQPKI